MTDNGSGYVAKLFRKALRMLRIRHIRTRPYTPKTNGKAERFIQTRLREWGLRHPSSAHPIRAKQTCNVGSTGIINSDHMLASASDHPFRPSPEQPDRIPHLGSVLIKGIPGGIEV